ncbi:MAG: PEP-CTERM sorting domain-containing protein [Chromatiales bacterium]|nr:PEP-CTERM sorting domain-containing protein [Chromatiales bacterium]
MNTPKRRLLPLAIATALFGGKAWAAPILDIEPNGDWASAIPVNIPSFEGSVGPFNFDRDFYRVTLVPGSSFDITTESLTASVPGDSLRVFDPAFYVGPDTIAPGGLLAIIGWNTTALNMTVPVGGVVGLRVAGGGSNQLEGYRITIDPPPIPAPATIALTMVGAAALAGLRRRQKRKPSR